MIEIELKFEIKDLAGIRDKLGNIKTKEVRTRTHELSVMYDNAEGLMEKTDGRIRLRQSGEQVEFCYKKPLTREGIKKEIEYEVSVSSFSEMEKILQEMGFVPVSSYERYRTEYALEKVKITLDEYPFATFVELEGEEKKIKELAEKLGFELKDNLTDSCDTLFTKWRQKQGLPPVDQMTFKDFDK